MIRSANRVSERVAVAIVIAVTLLVFWATATRKSEPISASSSPISPMAAVRREERGSLERNATEPAPSLPAPTQWPATRDTIAHEERLPSPPSGDYELTLSPTETETLLDARYGGFFAEAGLPADRAARVRSLLTQMLQATIDAVNAGVSVGLDPNHDLATFEQAIDVARAPSESALRTELGESRYAQLREADNNLGLHNRARDVAEVLASTPEPLRPEQQVALLNVLRRFPGDDSEPDLNRMIFGQTYARAAVTDDARKALVGVLTPVQLAALDHLQRHSIPRDSGP